jgi:hypothetical protein
MVKILYFADDSPPISIRSWITAAGCGATVRFETGEPCLVSIAQSGIIVKKSRYGLFGPMLYAEKVFYKNFRCAAALAYLFQDKRFPEGVSNPALRAFFNAILHCGSALRAKHSSAATAGCSTASS